jgi:AcrR family transcriptional regulator
MANVRAELPTKPKPSLRERNKQEKSLRIKEAARKIFRERGYRGATTRDIAEEAAVAMGTLFRYATDKRELLFMVINEELDEATERAKAQASKHFNKDLIGQLVAFYRPRYECFARYPDLGRHFVRESFFFMSAHEVRGPEARRGRERRSSLVSDLGVIIQINQKNKKVAKDVVPSEAAHLLHSLYVSDCRQWLEEEEPRVEVGLGRLKRLLALAVRGILP